MSQELDNVDQDEPLKLSRKQKLLVDKYIQCWNATRAAIAVGYSPNGANATASQTLAKPNVRKYLNQKLAEVAEKNQEKISIVIDQLMRIARADIRDFVDAKGKLRQINKNFDGQMVQKIKHTQYGASVTLHSKDRALELLGRYLGLWTDKVDITSGGQAIRQEPVTIIFEEIHGSPS
jgi:phage terminase small subunit